MNYIGSKQSLIEFLDSSIKSIVGSVESKIFADLFAGTGTVGKHFKKLGCKVIANDLMYYAFVLNRHYIGNCILLPNICKQIEELNGLDGVDGFVYSNYSPNEHCDRQYFTNENARKCDAVRQKIEDWKTQGKISLDEYYCLLATLLESIDKCANTASVYGAYLKHYKKSATRQFRLQELPILLNCDEQYIYNKDANALAKDIFADIVYLDPPYNSRQYSANYHLLETIAKYDRPQICGKTGIRRDKSNSMYCNKHKVRERFEDLICNINAKYIFLSYNNEGLLGLDDIKEILGGRGEYGFFKREYSRFKADKNRKYRDNTTTEYLHFVKVSNNV